jgi:hypothetical protein
LIHLGEDGEIDAVRLYGSVQERPSDLVVAAGERDRNVFGHDGVPLLIAVRFGAEISLLRAFRDDGFGLCQDGGRSRIEALEQLVEIGAFPQD